ncbi:sensor signal transduction histidine kinase [Novosphingobium sp. Rr 2-17]|uniref:ATP-binding protein n=1 Tax=Novosphingobium sp. Rr 2-17 TaxID=555793 RepID=UPI000269A52F|nr:ATP-binding protein [Novosphingobium sp. Rr 2-17]EIZ78506.1 sensor signal transduction histidine kinase [Novosphingobium sp. Rr 2-17]
MIQSEPFAPAAPDTGGQNMWLLIQLRWIAIGGQIITIEIVNDMLGIAIPVQRLLMVPALLMVLNLVSGPLLRRRRSTVSNFEMTAALLVDVAALAVQLYYSGGLENPFASLFVLQVVLGAVLLKPASAWIIAASTGAALAMLSVYARPLVLPPPYSTDPMALYVRGSMASLALIVILLVTMVTRISRNLRERDAALAGVRQRAVEDDHIVRMGLLASGAAHELGTPLSSLSVLIGDWKRMPKLATDRDLQEDLADMDQAVQRCKTIVSGILMSAGEARGVSPAVTTMRAFLDDLVRDWRSIRSPDAIRYTDRFGEDVPIVADPALRQVIGNVVDNAAEVSPHWIEITASRADNSLVLEVADSGPGFSREILGSFGRPYRSTKGKPGGGLGLFLLVNVARKLGGSAIAGNRAEGGAIVRITLPIEALAYRKEAAR